MPLVLGPLYGTILLQHEHAYNNTHTPYTCM